MPTSRSSSGAVNIPTLGVLVLGGWKMHPSSEFLRIAELLQEVKKESGIVYEWKRIVDMNERRCDPCGVYFEEKVYVMSKWVDSMEILSLRGGQIGQWTLITRCSTLNRLPSSMCVHKGRILLAGK